MKRRLGLTIESPTPTITEGLADGDNPLDDEPSKVTAPLEVRDSGTLVSVRGSLVIGGEGVRKAGDVDASQLLQVSESELEQVRVLGNGSFGVVNLMRVRTTGLLCAMKEIRVSDDAQAQRNIYREIKTSIRLSRNPFMVHTYNIYSASGNILHILLEYCSYGSAQDLLRRVKGGRLNENALGVFAIDTLRGLAYMHDTCRIIHRDIKSANILIDSEGYCKLADFGVASSVIEHDEEMATKTFCGSLSYLPPERVQNQNYSFNSDVWSMGLTYVELLTGKFPYSGITSFWDAMNAIVNGPPPRLHEEHGFSAPLCNLVNSMLEKDPAKRMSAAQLLKFPFCKKYLAKEDELRKFFVKWLKANAPGSSD